MNRTRLAIRLVLIVAVVVIFIARRDHISPSFAKGFLFALAFAVVMTIVRAVVESRKQTELKQAQQASSDGEKVDLFTKPKDF